MPSSAIPHVIKFLTRPLSVGFAPAAVKSAQRILNVLLAPEATFTLTSTTTPPTCLRAASLGSSIPWTAWFAALAGGRDVVLSYSPGSLKVRIADGPMDEVWSAEPDDGVISLLHILKSTSVSIPDDAQPTSARLQATLLSARVRRINRVQQRLQTDLVRMQVRLLLTPPAEPPSDDSDSGYSSDSSDCGSSSSKFTSYSADSQTSAASSQPAKDVCQCPSAEEDSACLALPLTSTRPNNSSRPRGRRPVRLIRVDRAKKHTATYLYEGGVSRVMTGGVMLGPHPAAHVVRATRS